MVVVDVIANLITNRNPDGGTTLNDCPMIQDYKETTKAL